MKATQIRNVACIPTTVGTWNLTDENDSCKKKNPTPFEVLSSSNLSIQFFQFVFEKKTGSEVFFPPFLVPFFFLLPSLADESECS